MKGFMDLNKLKIGQTKIIKASWEVEIWNDDGTECVQQGSAKDPDDARAVMKTLLLKQIKNDKSFKGEGLMFESGDEDYPQKYSHTEILEAERIKKNVEDSKKRLAQNPPSSVKEDKMKKKVSDEEGEAQWGFDLTSISAENWKKILLAGEISPKPVNDDGKWVWTGPNIKIHTGNDPISGKYGRTGGRAPEKDYASYIGIYGEKAIVKKIAKMISTLAEDIKEETPNKSRFI